MDIQAAVQRRVAVGLAHAQEVRFEQVVAAPDGLWYRFVAHSFTHDELYHTELQFAAGDVVGMKCTCLDSSGVPETDVCPALSPNAPQIRGLRIRFVDDRMTITLADLVAQPFSLCKHAVGALKLMEPVVKIMKGTVQ